MVSSKSTTSCVVLTSLLLNVVLISLLVRRRHLESFTSADAAVENLEPALTPVSAPHIPPAPAAPPASTQLPPTCTPCGKNDKYNLVSSEQLLVGSALASQIGRYGSRPWGTSSIFVEPNAYWIWAPGVSSHPKWLFFTFFQVTSSVNIDAVLHVICDQYGVAYVDGNTVAVVKEKGWLTSDYSKTKLSLGPGNHLLAIYAENQSPDTNGGVLAALVSEEGTTLVATDGKWKCKKISM